MRRFRAVISSVFMQYETFATATTRHDNCVKNLRKMLIYPV